MCFPLSTVDHQQDSILGQKCFSLPLKSYQVSGFLLNQFCIAKNTVSYLFFQAVEGFSLGLILFSSLYTLYYDIDGGDGADNFYFLFVFS